MRIGSLCSGIGALDLAVLEVFGGEIVWHAEIDPDACKVLEKRFPGVLNIGDIKTVDWTKVPPVDLLCGGIPCPPWSSAGQRRGIEDERHLWPYVVPALRTLRPDYLLVEQVGGFLHLGGLDATLADLAGLGFDAQWSTYRASAVGAPHRRERLFVVAHPQDVRRQRPRPPRHWRAGPADSHSRAAWGVYEPAVRRWERTLARPAPASWVDGQLSARFVEWVLGLPDGWVTDVLGRRSSLRVLGNVCMPQQAIAALTGLLDRLGS